MKPTQEAAITTVSTAGFIAAAKPSSTKAAHFWLRRSMPGTGAQPPSVLNTTVRTGARRSVATRRMGGGWGGMGLRRKTGRVRGLPPRAAVSLPWPQPALAPEISTMRGLDADPGSSIQSAHGRDLAGGRRLGLRKRDRDPR